MIIKRKLNENLQERQKILNNIERCDIDSKNGKILIKKLADIDSKIRENKIIYINQI